VVIYTAVVVVPVVVPVVVVVVVVVVFLNSVLIPDLLIYTTFFLFFSEWLALATFSLYCAFTPLSKF
jgi:hypothetical protein